MNHNLSSTGARNLTLILALLLAVYSSVACNLPSRPGAGDQPDPQADPVTIAGGLALGNRPMPTVIPSRPAPTLPPNAVPSNTLIIDGVTYNPDTVVFHGNCEGLAPTQLDVRATVSPTSQVASVTVEYSITRNSGGSPYTGSQAGSLIGVGLYQAIIDINALSQAALGGNEDGAIDFWIQAEDVNGGLVLSHISAVTLWYCPDGAFAAQAAVVQGGNTPQSVTIYNQSTSEIGFVYLSPVTDPGSGPNRLGSNTIPAGADYTIKDVTIGMYALVILDVSGKELFRIEIYIDYPFKLILDDQAISNSCYASVSFHNFTGKDIHYLYVATVDTPGWGEDWRNGIALPDGDSTDMTVPCGDYKVKAEDKYHIPLSSYEGHRFDSTHTVYLQRIVSITTLLIENYSSQPIQYVYITEDSNLGWGPNRLGTDVIPVGGGYALYITTPGYYEMKVEGDGHVTIDGLGVGFNTMVTEIIPWKVYDKGGSVIPTATPGTVSLTIINNYAIPIWYVYIYPQGNPNKGDDWLGDKIIPPSGGSHTFTLTPGVYAIRIEDSNHIVWYSEDNSHIYADKVITLSHATEVPPATSQPTATPAATYVPTATPQPTPVPTEVPPSASLTVINNSETAIWYVYIKPYGSENWGSDWLGSSIIPAYGGTYNFTLDQGTYDIKVENSEHSVMCQRNNIEVIGSVEWACP
ncbi:MAG: hypothetical protein FJZ96_12700 [Chloroflexi bacterium]|nr:hypothetical protein [Chloroflexota bacterium]